MTGKQLMFHATKEDIIPILSHIETVFDIKYVERGLFDEKKTVEYNTFSEIKDLGYTEESSFGTLFMLFSKNTKIIIRDVPQIKGGIKYAIDFMKNPRGIELTIGGIYTKEENILVMSRTAYVDKNPFSESIYKELTKKVKKSFKKYDFMEWVGPDAEQKLKEGWRLVQDAKRSKDYDLKYKE